MELSKHEVFKLIKAYQTQRVLWDSNHKGYFNKSIKTKAWQTIADAVEVDLENARRKMSSLLGSFRRERSKGKRANKDDPTSVQYKSDWFAFKAFSFLLDPSLNSINLDSGTPQAENSNQSEDQSDYVESAASQYEENTEDYVTPDATSSYIVQEINAPFPKPSTPKRKRRSSLHDNTNTEHHAKRDYSLRETHIANESVRKDATAKFSRYLEAKLNLFNPTASAILIHKINQLIFEAEMSSISQPHSYSLASGSPKSNWTLSPPHISPLVQIEVSRYAEKEDEEVEEDTKGGIHIMP